METAPMSQISEPNMETGQGKPAQFHDYGWDVGLYPFMRWLLLCAARIDTDTLDPDPRPLRFTDNWTRP